MTNPAVVILTDPARCQLADAEVLLKALLQVQQLSAGGVPASQAFCDHPTAAREFVDAYSKAYPELQQQSSDLPLPEHLYSMVAEGRFGPLPAVNAGEPTKPGESAQLYPLYVLSLGAPESLMNALQHHSVAKSNIRVLEIAPIEHSRVASVSVAEAVAQEPIARSSWVAESPNSPKKDDEDPLSSEALPAGEPLKLDTVEIDLDHVHVDRNAAKAHSPQDDAVLRGPEPAIVQFVPVSATVSDAGLLRQSHINEVAPAVNVVAAASDVEPASASVTAPAQASETKSTLPTGPAVVSGPAPDPGGAVSPSIPPVPPSEPGQSTDGGAGPPPLEGAADGSPTSSNPPDHGPPDHDPVAHSSEINEAPGSNAWPEEAPIAAASPAAEEAPVVSHPSSFADPGEDVRYPPTSDFEGGEDSAYPMPADLMPDAHIFEELFSAAPRADIVDIEALYSELRASDDASVSVEQIDLSLLRACRSDGAGSSEFPASPSMLPAVPRYSEAADPGQDEAPDQILTTVHDTDL